MRCPSCQKKLESIEYGGISGIRYKYICRQLKDHMFEYYDENKWQIYTEEYGITQTAQNSIIYLAKSNSYHDLPRVTVKDVCVFAEKYIKMIAFT